MPKRAELSVTEREIGTLSLDSIVGFSVRRLSPQTHLGAGRTHFLFPRPASSVFKSNQPYGNNKYNALKTRKRWTRLTDANAQSGPNRFRAVGGRRLKGTPVFLPLFFPARSEKQTGKERKTKQVYAETQRVAADGLPSPLSSAVIVGMPLVQTARNGHSRRYRTLSPSLEETLGWRGENKRPAPSRSPLTR